MNVRLSRAALAAAACITALAMGSAACGATDRERIEAQNEAARAGDETAAPVNPGDTRRVSVFDLRTGDCLGTDFFGGDGGGELLSESLNVDIVSCDDDGVNGRVSRLHLIHSRDGERYPGEDSIDETAQDVCAPSVGLYTYLGPIEDSWEAGDRTITCIEAVGFVYAAGDCVSGDDDDYRVAECDGSEFGEVTATIDLSSEYPADAPFPGEAPFDEAFAEECDLGADFFLFPTEDTWEFGDREIICIRTS